MKRKPASVQASSGESYMGRIDLATVVTVVIECGRRIEGDGQK